MVKIGVFRFLVGLFKVKVMIMLFDLVNFYGLGGIFKIKGKGAVSKLSRTF